MSAKMHNLLLFLQIMLLTMLFSEALAEMDDSEYERAVAEEEGPGDGRRERRLDSTTVHKLVASQA
jgi:hypothetical protein